MAKVTLILEDSVAPDGTEGLTIDYEPEAGHSEASLAHRIAAAFVERIIGQAKSATIEDKGPALPSSSNGTNTDLN